MPVEIKKKSKKSMVLYVLEKSMNNPQVGRFAEMLYLTLCINLNWLTMILWPCTKPVYSLCIFLTMYSVSLGKSLALCSLTIRLETVVGLNFSLVGIFGRTLFRGDKSG